jgi:hypothetical protein
LKKTKKGIKDQIKDKKWKITEGRDFLTYELNSFISESSSNYDSMKHTYKTNESCYEAMR